MYDLNLDYQAAAISDSVDWTKIDGKRVLVTGVTGLIGGQIVATLAARNRLSGAGIEIVCPVRDTGRGEAALARLGASEATLVGGIDLADLRIEPEATREAARGLADAAEHGAERGVNQELAERLHADLFIHAAAPTASKEFQARPVEVARAIVFGTAAMAELAVACRAESFCYLSSMEIYGDGRASRNLEPLTESEVGSSDLSNPRSSYPESKRMAECFVTGYSAQHQLNGHTVRLAQTFGPGISQQDARLFAQVARCALSGEDMVLKTTGASTRMYLYTADAVTAVLAVLARGKRGATYNAANPDTFCSVKEMCELVAQECASTGFEVRVEVDPNAPYPPDHHLPLNVEALRGLGWRPTVGLKEMFDRLIVSLR